MKRDNQLAARVLAQWAFKHFKLSELAALTASYQLSEKTLWNWKRALQTDRELSVLYEQRLNELLNQDWTKTLDLAIGATLSRLLELAPTANHEQARENFKVLAEVKITREVLAPQTALTKGNTAAETPPHRTLS
jgi:hypothetical protein